MFQGLANKKVVVIGVSSGIGLAVARKTAKLEAHVVMSSRSIEKLNQAMASVLGRVKAISADILNEASFNNPSWQSGRRNRCLYSILGKQKNWLKQC